jgi:hypothetical protein
MLVFLILEIEINDFKGILQLHNINTNAPVYFQMVESLNRGAQGHIHTHTRTRTLIHGLYLFNKLTVYPS